MAAPTVGVVRSQGVEFGVVFSRETGILYVGCDSNNGSSRPIQSEIGIE